MELLHYKILVKGKVQGVWFRKYAKEKAQVLGLKGYVKNEVNNNVYIEVEGSKDILTKFIEWLYEGSPFSKVSEVEYKLGELQNYSEFDISY
jgi:acylphosphatase